jgi:quinol monooxygenase YgiN
MNLNRRNLLTGGVALAGLSCLSGETRADGVAEPKVPDDAIILTAMVKAKAGQEDVVKEALVSLVKATRQEPGCLCYNLHQSKSDPTNFMFYEQWANKDATDAHGKTPHMKAIGGKLKGKTDKGGVVNGSPLFAQCTSPEVWPKAGHDLTPAG